VRSFCDVMAFFYEVNEQRRRRERFHQIFDRIHV